MLRLRDQTLALRLRVGDHSAARELVRRHHGVVYGTLRGLGADAALAEDLTQDTYARAWKSIHTLRDAASLRSWLLRIARNELLQHARRRQPHLVDLDEHLIPGDTALPDLVLELDRHQQDLELHAAVEALPEALREVVVLHYFQHLSLREVASVVGVPIGTAKSRLNRALGELRVTIAADQRRIDARRSTHHST